MDTRYGRVRWGAGEDRVRTSEANWKLPLRWNRTAEETGRQTFVFCASLADVFDNAVDQLWRADLFALIERTPALTWLLLTKRIGNVLDMTDVMRGHSGWPKNAAIGATMVNQEEYDRDRMKLREVEIQRGPAFTFGSFEPLLGPIILDKNAPDWIICGGESGKGAREMDEKWARDLRDGSERFGRAFFMKQMTGKKPIPFDLLVRKFPAAA